MEAVPASGPAPVLPALGTCLLLQPRINRPTHAHLVASGPAQPQAPATVVAAAPPPSSPSSSSANARCRRLAHAVLELRAAVWRARAAPSTVLCHADRSTNVSFDQTFSRPNQFLLCALNQTIASRIVVRGRQRACSKVRVVPTPRVPRRRRLSPRRSDPAPARQREGGPTTESRSIDRSIDRMMIYCSQPLSLNSGCAEADSGSLPHRSRGGSRRRQRIQLQRPPAGLRPTCVSVSNRSSERHSIKPTQPTRSFAKGIDQSITTGSIDPMESIELLRLQASFDPRFLQSARNA